MPTGVDGAVPMTEILGGQWHLSIPDYQRDYAWGTGDCVSLLEDLGEEAARQTAREPDITAGSGCGYYLGTVILASPPGSGTALGRAAELVDGQQRLVTLTMLIACLRDLEADEAARAHLDRLIAQNSSDASGARTHTLALRGQDGRFLTEFVQPPGATLIALPKSRLVRKRRIAEARECLRSRIAPLDEGQRRALAHLITDHCCVSLVTTESRDHAWRIFARINQRGKQLANADILKAVIIGALPDEKRPPAIAMWNTMRESLGTDFEGDAPGRRYLFSHIAERAGRTGNILESVIAQVQKLGAERFMSDVFEPVAKAFIVVTRRAHRSGTEEQNARINAKLTELSWIADTSWTSVALALLIRHARDTERLIAELGVLSRFMYGQMLLKRNQHRLKHRSDKIEQAAAALAQNDGDVSLGTILRFSAGEIRLIRVGLEYGLSAGPAKAVLARILLELGEATLETCDAIVKDKKWEVEHFVPKSPQSGHNWQAILGPGKSVGQYAKKLGNLYIASDKLNRQLDNLGFTRKLEILARYPADALRPCDPSLLAPGWSAKEMDLRHDKLIAVAESIWLIEAEGDSVPRPADAGTKMTASRAKRNGRPLPL